MENQKMDTYEMAVSQLENMVKEFKLSHDIVEYLGEPERVMIVRLPIKMDNGELKTFIGYRSQHCRALGPFKGGIRLHQNVSLPEVKALAMWMTWKTSLAGLPYGGAKGGIIVDPYKLSAAEKTRLLRRYTASILPIIGPETDIPAPDVGTNEKDMAIIMDTYNEMTNSSSPGVVTGKPILLGGSLGRREATGRGVMICVIEALKRMGIKPQDATVAVQGFGNVGSVSADLIWKEGCRVVAISDVSGGYYNPNGLNIPEMIDYCQTTKNHSLEGYVSEGMVKISNEELLELPVTVLVPAALERQITLENAGRIKAKLIVEGANGPTTPEADEILFNKGVEVIPDILANSGGVIVSYLEWVQSREYYAWKLEQVNQALKETLIQPFDQVWTQSHDKKIHPRIMATFLAVNRVFEAVKLREIFP